LTHDEYATLLKELQFEPQLQELTA
jgi:hypothetical protein